MLVDTSILMAFFNAGDADHKKAITCVKKILNNGETLDLPDTVYEELLALLRRRASKIHAIRAAKEIANSETMSVLETDNFILKKATELFIAYKGKYSYVDCTLVTVAEKMGVDTIVTLDRDFTHFGLKIVP